MRRDKQEITDKYEITDIINSAETARLGINRDGAPYVVPMNFGYADNIFYFHCAGDGLKVELLKADPRVCIEIDESSNLQKYGNENPCNWGVKYRSVIADGTAEFLTAIEEKKSALKIILGQFEYGELPPMSDKNIDSVTVFRVDSVNLTAKRSK